MVVSVRLPVSRVLLRLWRCCFPIFNFRFQIRLCFCTLLYKFLPPGYLKIEALPLGRSLFLSPSPSSGHGPGGFGLSICFCLFFQGVLLLKRHLFSWSLRLPNRLQIIPPFGASCNAPWRRTLFFSAQIRHPSSLLTISTSFLASYGRLLNTFATLFASKLICLRVFSLVEISLFIVFTQFCIFVCCRIFCDLAMIYCFWWKLSCFSKWVELVGKRELVSIFKYPFF